MQGPFYSQGCHAGSILHKLSWLFAAATSVLTLLSAPSNVAKSGNNKINHDDITAKLYIKLLAKGRRDAHLIKYPQNLNISVSINKAVMQAINIMIFQQYNTTWWKIWIFHYMYYILLGQHWPQNKKSGF